MDDKPKRQKTGGRGPGSKNKKTLEREEALRKAMAQISETLGEDAFQGDGVMLLQAVYKNPDFPADVRIEAATRAARYERPALSSVDQKGNAAGATIVYLPQGMTSEDVTKEWLEKYRPASMPDPNDQTRQ
jgi:hypothetical protein